MQPARELPIYLTRTATSLHKAHARGPINHAGGRRRRYSRLVFKGAESERNFSFLPHTGRLGVKTRHAPFLPLPLYITSQWRRIRKRILHSSSTAAYTHTHTCMQPTQAAPRLMQRACVALALSCGSFCAALSLSPGRDRIARARASERAKGHQQRTRGPPPDRRAPPPPLQKERGIRRERERGRERREREPRKTESSVIISEDEECAR